MWHLLLCRLFEPTDIFNYKCVNMSINTIGLYGECVMYRGVWYHTLPQSPQPLPPSYPCVFMPHGSTGDFGPSFVRPPCYLPPAPSKYIIVRLIIYSVTTITFYIRLWEMNFSSWKSRTGSWECHFFWDFPSWFFAIRTWFPEIRIILNLLSFVSGICT